MHDIRWIRDNPDVFQERLIARGIPAEEVSATIARLLELDEARRGIISKLQAVQERRNVASKEVGAAKAAKDEARAQVLVDEVGALKGELASGEQQQREIDAELEAELAGIPNLPLADVPVGADEHANFKKSVFGIKPSPGATKQHFEIGEELGGMDFETAAKLSGARFVVLKGEIARLERALGQFMLDVHTTEHGYTEVAPPLMVRDEVMFGTAQLPKFEEDQFATRRQPLTSSYVTSELLIPSLAKIEHKFGPNGADADVVASLGEDIDAYLRRDRLWLIPTAEVSLTNLVRESILSEEELPLRYTALTPCFRAEAGAAGKDTRGLIRQHQFNKVELVSITTPEQSADEHERMLSAAEAVLQKLELHYQVMTLSTGDMGFASQKTYDIEVWLPGQGTFREISSCSTCGEFQARRMQARFKAKDGKNTRFVHTLNGSGVAVGRALVAVLENYQNADGSVTVPAVLRPYMGGVEKIGAGT
jgi:seryl-tRNA synthetase